MDFSNDLIGMPEDDSLIADPADEAALDPEEAARQAEAAAHASRLLALQLIDRLQTEFPVATYPYDNISKEFNVGERAVYDLVERLLEQDVLTRVGATFEPSRLGYQVAVCSMSVEDEDRADVVSTIKGIHAIPRMVSVDGERNLWFTAVEPSEKALDSQLAQVADKTGYDVACFRPTHVFKNQVSFEIDPTAPRRLERPQAPISLASVRPAAMSDIDRQIARVLQGDISGERRPFSVIARMTADTCGEHLSEEEVIRRITRWCDSGVIRCLGAVVNPAKVGFETSAVISWSVPEKLMPVLGSVLAAQPEVSRVLGKAGGAESMGNVLAVLYGRTQADYTAFVNRVAAMLKKANLEVPEHTACFVTEVLKDAPARYFTD